MDNSSVLPHGYVLHGEKQSYVIDRKLGQGSFGITYLAKFKAQVTGQMGSGNVWMQVCVKEFFMRDMNSRDEQTMALRDATGNSMVMKYRRAFMREAHNLARMKHPGIVNVFEVIEANNTAYIVMEYIDGGSLDEYIAQRGRLPEKEALACFEPVCDAMCYMHAQRMLHLDMKPKNVMRDEEGHLYLIDFGLSKQYTENGEPESSTSIGLGTPGYAPLEQAEQRDDSKDFRTTLDVYALGATLYKMLTGQTPPTANEVNSAVLDGDNLIQSELRKAGVSAQVAKVVSTAMWPGAKKRYQTVPELMKALGWTAKTYKTETPSAQPKPKAQKTSAAEEVTVTTALPQTSEEKTFVQSLPKQSQSKPTPISAQVAAPKHLPKWLWPVVACAAVACLIFVLAGRNKPQGSHPAKQETAQSTSIPVTLEASSAPVASSSSSTTGKMNGHEWVDLGLSVKWATMNVGATSPEDYGSYFAWGETTPKSVYSWENLKYRTEGDSHVNIKFSKYVTSNEYGTVDNKITLDPADDAARANWGGSWRTPTRAEQDELRTKCTWTWTQVNGVDGYKVSSNQSGNTNSIFLPAAGYSSYGSLSHVGLYGRYLSSSLYASCSFNVYYVGFNSNSVNLSDYGRCYGRSVRPVFAE